MADDILDQLLDRVISYASASGFYDQVQGHEPKSKPPGTGLLFAAWLNAEEGTPLASGLAATSVRIEINARIYCPFRREPEDLIDPTLGRAGHALFAALSGDFDLGGLARNVDLLGAHGPRLAGRTGYQQVDEQKYRVYDMTIPIIVNDLFEQGA